METCRVMPCRLICGAPPSRRFLHQMQDQGIRPAVILDDPTLPYEPAECVSRTQSLAACEATRGAALSTGEALMRADLGVLKADASVPVLAPADFLCDEAGCPLELHGHLLYADTNHLTLGATQLMEPQLLPITRDRSLMVADQTGQSAVTISGSGSCSAARPRFVDHLDPRLVNLRHDRRVRSPNRRVLLVDPPLRGQRPVPRWLE